MPKPTFFALPDDKRARVIDAAVVEFARVPYAKASLDVVAKNAGVSKGSLYQYFDDKRDLYGWLVLTAMPARKLAAAAAATVTTTTGARTGTSHEPLTAPLEGGGGGGRHTSH